MYLAYLNNIYLHVCDALHLYETTIYVWDVIHQQMFGMRKLPLDFILLLWSPDHPRQKD